jgi:hypothetical protein
MRFSKNERGPSAIGQQPLEGPFLITHDIHWNATECGLGSSLNLRAAVARKK